MTVNLRHRLVTRILFLLLVFAPIVSAAADQKLGIFELIHEARAGFDVTASAVEAALGESPLELHGHHDITIGEGTQRARIFVLTAPELQKAASEESPYSASGQIIRVAVYEHGEAEGTLVNMANPVANAMVFYSKSDNYDAIIRAARNSADMIRSAIGEIPGERRIEQRPPLRSENHYRRFKGDGPARMMAKFRNWQKSQLVIREDRSEHFEKIIAEIADRFAGVEATTAEDPSAWHLISQIRVHQDAVYFGITNRYTENKMVLINSDFRKQGKTEDKPYPGIDHVAALPLEVLVVRDGDKTRVVHYGQMWRMQLYFWDSGYRAFTSNVGIPGAISKSIESWLSP